MRVVHTTGYNYDAPVTSSYNEARLTPRSDTRQNVILNRVETDPATRSYRYTDYWGTAVTAFDLHAPHTSLEVAGSSVVETDAFVPPEETLDWEDLAADPVVDRFNELLGHSTYVPRNRQLTSVAKKLAKDLGPYDAVVAVCDWVNQEMSYVPGTTGVHTSAVEAWAEKKGVCQDYAHLTLVLLRSIGIPARYVSGYLHPNAEAVVGDSVEGQSHAWIEAWTGSWWGYDPTNGVPVNEQHVSVGIGRDYADVPPLKGIFSGGGSTELDVVVEITRLA
ncbi:MULTISPECIES: transglutaminase family protein [unclassified Rhodococcus (in: high G+C Gram-positive bacteria)]|jgi:transglutaminase-like putative cysteine protease|uniref:transglutaminase family protein n=1 Tax=unclassified Rhodococcus (in: high G+C Gram-positive bacteria) TaxID=192944 RepID=UPI001C9A5902|nr:MULTISPECIES: transglutaminase family protein [unclassified Rhodococcus (in: high G+C Gram-positive bacteria)]MBY6676157.1 transglutaminase family protein [Rhodococcus sp. BP-332]MBY6686375.1 transglutaminase family protein [Rhodococcus sp. BP-288]MBY6693536.1 transglutaminase family protein [Rhodococcus sp. BP-188]MBY6699867.1 transglutaminase family protein [Rhodococcus sp. BP-285]MBY6703788.1 transglutaminase family protein [Rhodococcus sp. BP-283]